MEVKGTCQSLGTNSWEAPTWLWKTSWGGRQAQRCLDQRPAGLAREGDTEQGSVKPIQNQQLPLEEVCAWGDGQIEKGQAFSLLESLLSVVWPEVL